jgi:hypothetical protein
MKGYLVRVWTYAPYKREIETTEEASDFRAAIGRAIKKFRKELGRKKVSEISVNAKNL